MIQYQSSEPTNKSDDAGGGMSQILTTMNESESSEVNETCTVFLNFHVQFRRTFYAPPATSSNKKEADERYWAYLMPMNLKDRENYLFVR